MTCKPKSAASSNSKVEAIFVIGWHLLIHILANASTNVAAMKNVHYIHWNTSNPIFRIDNTDHIIDVNHDNKPWEYDQVNIICPVYRPGQVPRDSDKERSIIYSVSKDEYETCRITQPNPRVIAMCNKPHELMYFTITFRSFTPTPGGMEFVPGQDYYFVSTSSKENLYQRVGGRCSTHHMKVAFKVAENIQHSTTKSPTNKNPVVNAPRALPPASFPPGKNGGGHYEVTNHKELSGFMFHHPSSKRRDDYDYGQHPNDVVKHEASRLAASDSASEVQKATASLVILSSFLCAILLP